MRSMFTAKPPTARTFSSASTMSAELCRRPIVSSTESDIVCGLTLTRSTPWARRTRSLSSVIVSGRPASTVYSRSAPRSNSRSSAVHSLSSWAAFSVVGVPPPMYIDTTRSPSARSSAPTAETSFMSASMNGGMSFMLFSTDWLTKLQYAQRVGQKGMPT